MSRDVLPLPPQPADPSVCRWCAERLDSGLCHNDCTPNDAVPHVDGRCEECNRRFQTGQKWASICWQCERRHMAELTAEYQGQDLTNYTRDRIAFHANLRAVKAKDVG